MTRLNIITLLIKIIYRVVVIQSPSHVWLFMTPWTATHQSSLSLTISKSLLKFKSIEWVMPPNNVILCCPFLFLPSIFPASGSFPMSQLFASGVQSIGASASALVLPKSIQGWFPLRLTSLISLLSNGLSRAFSSTKFQSINSLVFCLLHCPALISVHDYWKDPCLGYMDLCWKSDTFAFPLIV